MAHLVKSLIIRHDADSYFRLVQLKDHRLVLVVQIDRMPLIEIGDQIGDCFDHVHLVEFVGGTRVAHYTILEGLLGSRLKAFFHGGLSGST